MLPQVTDKRLTLHRKSQRDTSGSEVDGSGMQFLRGRRPAWENLSSTCTRSRKAIGILARSVPDSMQASDSNDSRFRSREARVAAPAQWTTQAQCEPRNLRASSDTGTPYLPLYLVNDSGSYG
jgi:hypothetical protein